MGLLILIVIGSVRLLWTSGGFDLGFELGPRLPCGEACGAGGVCERLQMRGFREIGRAHV